MSTVAGRGSSEGWWRVSTAVFLGVMWTVLGVVVPAGAAEPGPAKLVLVLDSSGSMRQRVDGQAKIDLAKQALRRVVDRLPDDAPVGLRVYGATVEDRGEPGACTDSQLAVGIGTDNRTALASAITRYRPYGETPIAYALKRAARDLGTSGRRSVVLVSDGRETCDADPCATAARLAQRGIDLTFDVIGLRVSGQARDQLRCIAEKGRGRYYDADNAAQIADSLDRLTTRALRPFRVSGEPVRGSTKPDQAPLLRPGRYVDTFPTDDSTLYFSLARSSPGTTLHAGVSTEAAGFLPALNLSLESADGSICGSGSALALNVHGTRRLLSAEVNSWQADSTSACQRGDELLLTVGQPLRGISGRPLELIVVEEPAALDVATLALPPPRRGWSTMPRLRPVRAPVPGLTLSDAPIVRPGTYTGTILTGEKQVYAVELDWGQRLQAQVLVAPRTGALARALGPDDSLELQLFGAVRGGYPTAVVPRQPPDTPTMIDDEARYQASAATPTIQFINRSDLELAPAGLPGSQYVVISKSRMAGKKAFLVPYTLVLQVFGTAGRGAPRYASAATPSPTPTPIPSSTPTPSPTSLVSSPTASAAPVPEGRQILDRLPFEAVVAIAVAVVALAGVGATAWLRRSRRAKASGRPPT